MLTVTPLPWLPSWGLTTTGRPTSSATAQASSTSLTGRPMGTGTPAACSRRLVRSLSWAMVSATELVWSTSAAWNLRALEPQPSCTRLPAVRRRKGMPRARAALTSEPVEGPTRSSSSSSCRAWMAALASKAVSFSAAWISSSASAMARLPTASSVYSTTTWKVPVSTVAWVRLKVTWQPAWACRARPAASSTWARDRVLSMPWACRLPMAGKRARSLSSKPAMRVKSASSGVQCTTHSIAVLRLQRLGPRRARVREISMVCLSAKFGSNWHST